MTLGAGSLLRLLGSGVGLAQRVAGGADRTPIEGASFAELLDRVSRGELRDREPVRVEAGAGVELSAEQLARVSEAGARLEASGVSRGLILIDDMALEYDVLTRTVTGVVELGEEGAIVNIDGVARASAVEEQADPVGLPGSAPVNVSLLRALAGRGDAG